MVAYLRSKCPGTWSEGIYNLCQCSVCFKFTSLLGGYMGGSVSSTIQPTPRMADEQEDGQSRCLPVMWESLCLHQSPQHILYGKEAIHFFSPRVCKVRASGQPFCMELGYKEKPRRPEAGSPTDQRILPRRQPLMHVLGHCSCIVLGCSVAVW